MNTTFLETVLRRRSIRRYQDRSVPPAEIEKVLDIASSAPSAHNSQPWHFVVITSPQARQELVRAMTTAWDRTMKARGIPSSIRGKRTARNLDLVGNAPVIVVPYLVQAREGREERTMALQSVAVATGYLLLAATARGLGACWYAAPLFCPEVVNRCLCVRTDWAPQALVTLGYPAESPPPRPRRSIQKMVTHAQ